MVQGQEWTDHAAYHAPCYHKQGPLVGVSPRRRVLGETDSLPQPASWESGSQGTELHCLGAPHP